MGLAALALGALAVVLTITSQAGLGPGDFATVALVGLLGCLVSVAVWSQTRSRAALGGFALSAMPVVLLVYFLAVSDG